MNPKLPSFISKKVSFLAPSLGKVGMGLLLITLGACSRVSMPDAVQTNDAVSIYPDYKDVTVPVNIAPLNFMLADSAEAVACLSCDGKEYCYEAEDGSFHFDEGEWKELTANAKDITVSVCTKGREGQWMQHPDFTIHVSTDSIEPYVVYRRIVPGYHKWYKMGLYQRSLEDFEETALIENSQTENSCVNCHTFNHGDASRMVFHQRAVNPGTFLVTEVGEDTPPPLGEAGRGLSITRLDPELGEGAEQGMVYPAWHPSGNYIAFSRNNTAQDMYAGKPLSPSRGEGRYAPEHVDTSYNRIEVFDTKSSIQIYDIRNNRLYTTPLLSDAAKMNTFPTFTPDGKSLVYCSADTVSMPEHFREIRYNLVSVSFDPENGGVGDSCRVIYDAVGQQKSALLPRFSPDGHRLLFTEADYGTFPIWHHEADLKMLDIESGATDSLAVVNSSDTESFHSWSQTSRWFLFSSRRDDGLFTRLYITHIDKDGKTTKPFMLPQSDANYNRLLMQSYNVPELVDSKVASPITLPKR